MSLVTDLQPTMLQVRVLVEKPSGAKVEKWQDLKNIDVALYLTDDMKYTQSIKYNSSSHIGITFYKGLDKHTHRFRVGETYYTIEKVSERSRLTRLLLKVVEPLE